MISLQKFRGNKGENSKWIFPPPFPVESLGIFPCGNFPGAPLKYFKMQFNDKGRVPVMWKYPSSYLMSFFGKLKCLQVWVNFPLISIPISKFSPKFPCGFPFHLQPKFLRGFPPPTNIIPGDSPRNPWDFARWGLCWNIGASFALTYWACHSTPVNLNLQSAKDRHVGRQAL